MNYSNINDEELREIAKKRVGFKNHLWGFLLFNIVFLALNLIYSPEILWFFWITLFWGIGLFFHWRDAYYGSNEAR
jgi:hypothetical protein